MATEDRKPYETATVLNQAFLDDCHDNLTNQLELIVDIETPVGWLYLSDRNKYVGSTYYEARLNFPVITRTIGEYLSPVLEFSQLQIEVNNVDGAYNDLLPAGNDYDGWVGKQVIVKLGLRDVASTYSEIFRGRITEQGGFLRSVNSITFTARNDFERYNVNFPTTVFKSSTYPDIEQEYDNRPIPIIYGDWTTNIQPNGASIPAFVVNGLDPDVNGDSSFSNVIQCVISKNANSYFDSAGVYVVRGDVYYPINSGDVINLNANKNYFEVRQSGTMPAGSTTIDGSAYEFQTGDKFYCKIKGKTILGSYDDNIVAQAKDILVNEAGVSPSDFSSNWNAYRDKNTPSESAISLIKSRIWIQEPQPVLTYVLSLLEQVRLESFINRSLKFDLSSIHLDDFVASPTKELKNWDIVRGSFTPRIDDRNNFNRVIGSYNYLPNRNEDFQETPIYRNNDAITQTGKEISKKIVFPNLYIDSDVQNQLKEILRIASAMVEIIETSVTWRSMLLDISEFVKMNVDIQGIRYENIPALVREIGYDPAGLKIILKMWSLQMLPFSGYTPGYPGTVGGSTATIVQE